MGKLWLKISIIAVVIAFLGTSFVPANSLIDHTSSNNLLSGHIKTNDQSSSSDPSVHLYVNGNGYVIFSANYTVCCISFNYDNDKTQNFTSNDVPTGTVFHLVSSPNSGYAFQKWTGSVNSTSNSINVTVDQNINEEAIYEKILTFSANFTESALPTGNTWYVNITGLQTSGPITQTSYNVSLPNGTYTFYVATTNRDYAPNPYSNSFTVSGSPVSVPEITFSLETYILTFTESGLPEGIWYVNLSNGDQGSAVAGSPITFSLPNESYSYTTSTSNKLYHSSSYTGTVDVIGNTSVSILFVQTTYIVQFTETGLPSGQSWYVNITETNGTIYHSGAISTSSYSFSLTNGSYSFSVASANRIYTPSPPSTSFTLNGSLLSESITFNEVLYSEAFTESGLPSGESWYVNLSNGISSGPITGSSYIFSLTNGSYTYTIASANKVYAPNLTSGSFTVYGSPLSFDIKFFAVTYTVTFQESGLPSGTTWYVNITGMASSGPITINSYSIDLTNGTYLFAISTSDKNYAPSYNNSFTVKGSNASIPVAFKPVIYDIQFNSMNLPSGDIWYVNISGQHGSGPITSSTYTVYLQNGSYSFSVASANKIYAPSYVSAFTVNGSSLTIPVTFTEILYNLTIQESGLPTGTEWNLTFGGTIYQLTNASYIFSVPNGTYSFFAASHDYKDVSGTIKVNGSSFIYTINMELQLYEVTFNESGLPSGTTWYVNLSNGMDSGPITGSSYSFNLTNGSYSFSVASANKIYAPNLTSGSFTVNGSSLSKSITFSEVLYSVTFNESRLPSVAVWYVNLSNGMTSGPITGSSYSFSLTNGSYSYTVATSNKIYTSPAGSFTVNGSPISESIAFSMVKYVVTFTETGLPSGFYWYVNGSGLSGYESSQASISFNLSNGTYSFTVTNLSSYYTTTSHFTVVINGKNVTENVNYYHWAYITGSISPANADLTVNGKTVSLTSSGSFNISVPNGTYHAVISDQGYISYYSNFTLNSGNDKNLTVSLEPIPGPSISSNTVLYTIIGAVIAITVVSSMVVMVKKRK